MSKTDCNLQECVRVRLKHYLESKGLEKWLNERIPAEFEAFYSSFDLRDAGYKLAPVDANLYPAGFNNICSEDLSYGTEVVRSILMRHLGRMPKSIAILPEAHTKNKYYVDNLFELRDLFRRSGVRTEIGWWDAQASATNDKNTATVMLQRSDGTEVEAYPFWKDGESLTFKPFTPEFVVVNNDFSIGYPAQLENIAQPMEPSPKMGWHTRRKSDFFEHYNKLAGELAEAAGLDPWTMQVATELARDVNFDDGQGMDRVAEAVDRMIVRLKEEYAQHGVEETPFVFVKNNAGTYGMAIMKVESGAELLSMNRREKNKMAVGKNKLEVREVIVQEGIPTRFQFEGVFSEPVIYMMGRDLLGGFLRKNPTRGRVDNLNSAGMVFQKLCMSDLRHGAERDMELELVYGTVARIASAAIALEMSQLGSPLRSLSNTDTSVAGG